MRAAAAGHRHEAGKGTRRRRPAQRELHADHKEREGAVDVVREGARPTSKPLKVRLRRQDPQHGQQLQVVAGLTLHSCREAGWDRGDTDALQEELEVVPTLGQEAQHNELPEVDDEVQRSTSRWQP